MYLLKGPISDGRMTVEAIYDLTHPRNAGVSRAGGVEAEAAPDPPAEEGMSFRVFYDCSAGAYIYEAVPLPEPPAEAPENIT